jgi:lipopolysaccharide/colanic/teichoic acid biosynthesis glycosyltransferase
MNTRTHIQPNVSRLKRIIDFTIALIVLLLTWPLFIAIAILVKLTSKGPVIYSQRRVGRILQNKTDFFIMYKFRTMTNKAESSTGAVWAVENDPRLTVLGKALRKTRLDELPQLVNVLKGDMSLVGPRPERPEIALQLEKQIPYYLERTYGVLPGITGLAQVYQGYDASIDDVKSKILYDFAYSLSLTKIPRWLKMDCIIICRTIWIMILGRGR